MYVIIVYDVAEERVNKVRIYLKQYLNWVQNNVICYKSKDRKYLAIDEIGTKKAEITNII